MKYLIWAFFATFSFWDCKAQDLVPFRADALWGYKDIKGTVMIEPQYQYATKFWGNIAVVTNKGKIGAINKENHILIPFQYEFLQPLDSTEFLFGHRAKYFGEYIMGVMTSNETIKIPAEYNYISKHNDTYTVVRKFDSVLTKSPTGDVRSVKSFYGLVDNNGEVLIPCKYDYLSWINDSLLVLTIGGSGTSQALFNKKGEQLTGFEYMVFGNFLEGIAKARIGNKFGFIYPTGQVAIPIKFDYCEDFKNGFALIKQNEKWGAINKKGQIIIEPKFEYQEANTKLKEK